MSRIVGVCEDEWYPCYALSEPQPWNETAEIDDDKAAWIERVMGEFYEVQEYLEKLYKGVNP